MRSRRQPRCALRAAARTHPPTVLCSLSPPSSVAPPGARLGSTDGGALRLVAGALLWRLVWQWWLTACPARGPDASHRATGASCHRDSLGQPASMCGPGRIKPPAVSPRRRALLLFPGTCAGDALPLVRSRRRMCSGRSAAGLWAPEALCCDHSVPPAPRLAAGLPRSVIWSLSLAAAAISAPRRPRPSIYEPL